MKRTLTLALCCILSLSILAQNPTFADDTLNPQHKYLPDVTVVGRNSRSDIQGMPEVVGTSIYAGKKNALVVMDNVQGNVSMNVMRQVMAKIPGIHIWESDPSGIQIGIAARGLSPNRSWEFNVRQNGYDIAADPFGYPEAYYNPQLQAVQRIEVVRGHSSLQYGAQFGGMVNYILRNGSEIKKKFEFESQQTVGSNGLFNTYNAIGGKSGNWHYYGFFDHRNGNGYRQNSRFFTDAGYGTATYYFGPRLSLTAELMHSHIRSQQAGGLTDAMLYEDPRQSFRARNWFDISWTNPAMILNYQVSASVRWNTKLFATIGNRNSVGFLQNILVKDSINLGTGEYNSRTLNKDQYRNYGMESRVLADYSLGKMKNVFAAGIRLYTGSTYRRADGKGSTRERAASLTVLSGEVPEPKSYGRIVRGPDGDLAAIVEEKDASAHVKQVREINSGVMAFEAPDVWATLDKIQPSAASGELYLTDAIELTRSAGRRVHAARAAGPEDVLGVNDRVQLAQVTAILRRRINELHMLNGVTIVDPDSTFIDARATLEHDVRIEPFSVIEGPCQLKKGARIGPFARLRASTIGEGALVGNFVEVVRSEVGREARALHLAYLGDGALGAGVNVGAGTIFANWDGYRHSTTTVGEGASLGAGTVVVAPSRIGAGARTGAGAVVIRGEVEGGVTVVGVPARPITERERA